MPVGDGRTWRATAFGLELAGDFPAPGLSNGSSGEGRAPRTRLTLVARSLLDGAGASTLYEAALPPGSFSIARLPSGAFLADHPFYGRYRVTADGALVECAPARHPAWVWQRFLVGQILPLAALVSGYEPLHASGVVLARGAVLVMGPSGAGKSSVAAQLASTAGSFLTDDVAALELRDGAVWVHSGPPLTSLDPEELARLPPGMGGQRLGELEGEVRLAMGVVAEGPACVAAVYLLNRRPDAAAVSIAARATDALPLLLGGTFNAYLRTPERLVRQLEVCTRLVETASVRELIVPPSASASDVAAAIEADAP
jgi:hypothetical protein